MGGSERHAANYQFKAAIAAQLADDGVPVLSNGNNRTGHF
jgi:hypothetical protein